MPGEDDFTGFLCFLQHNTHWVLCIKPVTTGFSDEMVILSWKYYH